MTLVHAATCARPTGRVSPPKNFSALLRSIRNWEVV